MGKRRSRDTPAEKKRGVVIGGVSAMEAFLRDAGGYVPLYDTAEVRMCVHQYADLVSNMTVRVMQNTPRGDTRVKNALADFLDRTPSKVMNRKTFVYWIVETLFTAGDGNAVVLPVYDGDLLTDLVPVDPASVIFEQTTDADL